NALIKGTVGIASYNHWTDECRPNTHQPYFAFTVRSQTKEYKFSLTNDCHREVSLALRYLPTGGSWRSVCWYNIRSGETITPSDADGNTLRTTNGVWYFYAETSSLTWRGTDNTRTCRGRSLGMRKMTEVWGSKLTLRLTCNSRRRLSENETSMSNDEMPDQQLCLLADDGLEGTVENDADAMDVLAFPNHDEDEGVGVPVCTEIEDKDSLGVPFSKENGLAFQGFGSKALPRNPRNQTHVTNDEGEVIQEPSCDETCVAIEESSQELQKKLAKINDRRLGEVLV
ncbi:unnamed protein product, partial [Symbiodinium necroappetens]